MMRVVEKIRNAAIPVPTIASASGRSLSQSGKSTTIWGQTFNHQLRAPSNQPTGAVIVHRSGMAEDG